MPTERVGDPAIEDSDELWRCVHVKQLEHDPQSGLWRTQLGTFIDRNTGELSVDVARRTTLEAVRSRRPGKSIVAVTAAAFRRLGYRVCSDPVPADNADRLSANPAHAVICPKITTAHARELATQHAVWVYLDSPAPQNNR
ncbi:MAG TPA: hypothetical protein VK137_20195 [Planctomycetaceae bacterium]|nr:hypothetical protein [Planctomycetaceae bacterium]